MVNSLVIVAICLAGFGLAYRFYSRYLAERVLGLDPSRKTPAQEFEDGIDFVPTRKEVLFGHHFASIAGLGPIVGPAVAVIWGWLPALLWIVLGSIFMGAVHDLAALYLSLRHRGVSIGALTERIIGRRARVLFLFLIFFILALAMGVFANKVALLFATPLDQAGQPDAVLPTAALIGIALLIGVLVYRVKRLGLLPPTLIGLVLMALTIWLGTVYPITGISYNEWIALLLGYTFAASVLPVWLLLQPRDYINSFQLYFGLLFIFAGLVVYHPPMAAPAVNWHPEGAPPMLPFIFIVVACGALSGFHNLVSSGTTVRQLKSEADARFVGYGGMITEGVLALGVLMACAAALPDRQSWLAQYPNWRLANEGALGNFIGGAGIILTHLGIPEHLGRTFTAVVCVSFAMTTLDTATRLLRYNIEEIGKSFDLPWLSRVLGNRFAASALAVAAIGYFALIKVAGRSVGAVLWQLFGTSNQLLAGLGLLMAVLYLLKQRRPYLPLLAPMVLVFLFTISAMLLKLLDFWRGGDWAVFGVGLIILVLAGWMVVEAILAIRGYLAGKEPDLEEPMHHHV
ncbi:MAG: hypothetical protein A2V67_12970 [Deltaproteobacteria bacterium RBG_13_61_14]|nr:MAG: hypothetical protein A2V67_12970 [Deltaproteobacteria bacterium RBG_13_61_14]